MAIDTTTIVPCFETARTATVTLKGSAVLAVYAMLAALRELSDGERSSVLELLHLELERQV